MNLNWAVTMSHKKIVIVC